MRPPIVTLLTDFGTKDPYLASMKGVILNINPQCILIDITHQVSPHDIQEGAFLLARSYSYFPKGTIHLSVVDPGVGSPRKPLLIATARYFFIGPDNGLFSLSLKKERVKKVVALTNQKFFLPHLSTTFHGRDIFAPVAGFLSLGIKPKDFGNEVDSWREFYFRKPKVKDEALEGEILHVDTFGNLISNLHEQQLFHFGKRNHLSITVGKKVIRGLKKGYWEGKKGEPIALLDSDGFLEISIREGNAQKRLKIKRGDRIQVELEQKA